MTQERIEELYKSGAITFQEALELSGGGAENNVEAPAINFEGTESKVKEEEKDGSVIIVKIKIILFFIICLHFIASYAIMIFVMVVSKDMIIELLMKIWQGEFLKGKKFMCEFIHIIYY